MGRQRAREQQVEKIARLSHRHYCLPRHYPCERRIFEQCRSAAVIEVTVHIAEIRVFQYRAEFPTVSCHLQAIRDQRDGFTSTWLAWKARQTAKLELVRIRFLGHPRGVSMRSLRIQRRVASSDSPSLFLGGYAANIRRTRH